MNTLAALRRSALLLAVLALVAGCATPGENRGPVDNMQDGDRDGIPDNESPVEGANEPGDNATQPGQNISALNETLP